MTVPVGFIGLGIMGSRMAQNLLTAGYPLTVWNRTASKMKPLLAAGAKAAENPGQVAAHSEVIFTMLTDGPQVREVALGENGIVEGAKPGTILVDTSSIAPSVAKEVARELAKHEIQLLDAPVSGGPEGADKGTLSIMVGGEKQAFDQVLPMMQVLGKKITHVGPCGAGQLMKLCNQISCGMNILGMCEALALGEKGGLDPALVREVLMAGAANSWMLENWAPKIINRDYAPGFTVSNFQKDLRNILMAAANLNLPLPGTSLAHQLYRANEAAGESEESNVAVYKVLKRLAGE